MKWLIEVNSSTGVVAFESRRLYPAGLMLSPHSRRARSSHSVNRFAISCMLASSIMSCIAEREPDPTAEDVAENLQSLSYTAWSPLEHAGRAGVVGHDRSRAYPALNLFNSLPRARATLMDMEGKTLHEWSLDAAKEWAHVMLRPNGDLLVLSEIPRKLLRLDWESNVIWEEEIEAHHDIDIADNGDLYVLTGKDERVDHDGVEIPIRNEFILILTPDGRKKRRLSFLPIFRHLLDFDQIKRFVETNGEVGEGMRFEGDAVDIFHVNTLSIIDRTHNDFLRKGFVLVAARSLNRVAVIDLEAEELVWSWGENDLDWPHQPVLLGNGNLLIFDNGTHRKYSRVIELDPTTAEIVWEYKGDPPKSFYTALRGGIQKLTNGNILVTESRRGRAFEITHEGMIVWDFYNPDIYERPKRRSKRATIYCMTRIAPDFLNPRLWAQVQ